MIKAIIGAILLCFVSSSTNAGSPWTLRHVFPDSYDLFDVTLNEQTGQGVSVGLYGVFHTVEGFNPKQVPVGYIWKTHRINTDKSLYSVQLIGADTIVVGADGGTVFRSVDYGKAWSEIQTQSMSSIISMSFAGSSGVALSSAGQVLRSSDKGLNWEIASEHVADSLLCIRSIGDSVFIAVGKSSDRVTRVYVSRNASSWVEFADSVNRSPAMRCIEVCHLHDGLQPEIFVAGDDWLVERSTDFGKTWNVFPIFSVYADRNSQMGCYGFAMGDNAQIGVYQSYSLIDWTRPTVALFTRNGGDDWDNLRNDILAAPADGYTKYSFYSDSEFVAFGSLGRISFVSGTNATTFLYSFTGGSTPTIQTVQRFDDSRFGLGASFSGTTAIAWSDDRAKTWQFSLPFYLQYGLTVAQVASPMPGTFIAVADSSITTQINPSTWSTSFHSRLARSSDYGATWSRISIPDGSTFQSSKEILQMFDEHEGALYYWGRNYLRTHDGGATWDSVPYNFPSDFVYSGFISSRSPQSFDIGAYDTVTKKYTVLRTTDAAAHWDDVGAGAYPGQRDWPMKSLDGTWTMATSNIDAQSRQSVDSVFTSVDQGYTWSLRSTSAYDQGSAFYTPYAWHRASVCGPYGISGSYESFAVSTDSARSFHADTSCLSMWGRPLFCRDIVFVSPTEALIASNDFVLLDYDFTQVSTGVHEDTKPPSELFATVFPNADCSVLHVNADPRSVIRVFNEQGLQVLATAYQQAAPSDLDISTLPSGAYYARVGFDNRLATHPFRVVR